MVKIQVKGSGFHPRIGFLPKLNPFYAEQNTIGWLLTDDKLEINYFDPDENVMQSMDRKNYIEVSNKTFTEKTPVEISDTIWNPVAPTPEPPNPVP